MAAGKLYLICGDDEFAVKESARHRVDTLVAPGDRDFLLDTVNGDAANADEALAAANACVASLRTDPLFGGEKTTWLRQASFFVRKGGGSDDEAPPAADAGARSPLEILTAAVKAGIPAGHVLVIDCLKINRASALFKACKAAGEVEDFGSREKKRAYERERDAELFAGNRAKRLGLTLDAETCRFFIRRAGTDSRTIASELDKLATYVLPETKATVADVEAVVSLGHEEEAWELNNAFDSGDVRRVFRFLETGDGDKGAPVMFTAMLENHLRDLIAVRWALDRRWISNGRWVEGLSADEKAARDCSPVNPENTPGWKLGKLVPAVAARSLVWLRTARHHLNGLRTRLVLSSVDGMTLLRLTVARILAK